MRAVAIEDASQVAQGRREAAEMAVGLGFDKGDAGRVALVATELATNLLKHGGGGELLVGTYDEGDGAGVECIALDHGPGIARLADAMRDGHSSAGSAGTGLGAIARQSQLMDVYSSPGRGAAVLARLRPRTAPSVAEPPAFRVGAVSLPVAGEEACGDAWCVRRERGAVTAMVVDGLGHGPLAAAASHAAVKVFDSAASPPSSELMARLHAALRSTRGAAASIARLAEGEPVTFIGVGNVAGVLATEDDQRRMVTYNGTLGHSLKSARVFSYPAVGEAMLVLASDGLGTIWSLDDYPGLRQRHPTLVAAVLYRDFSRGRDDVTVLVVRREAA